MKGKKKIFLEALKEQLGIVTPTAKQTGINRTTHYKWLKEDPEYKAEVDLIPDLVLDFAENALFKLMQEKNVAATIFFLKCNGKHRGYVERHELSHSMNTPLIIKESVYDGSRDSPEQQTEGSDGPSKGQ